MKGHRTALLFVLAACGSPQQQAESGEEARASGEVVARVNGRAIGAGDVEEVARRHGSSPREALDWLIDEAVLVQEANRRGVRAPDGLERRLTVRALLAQLEAENAPADVTPAEIRVEYDETVARMPGVQLPSMEEAEQEIRTLLAGRARLEALTTLIQSLPEPERFEERTEVLIDLVEIAGAASGP